MKESPWFGPSPSEVANTIELGNYKRKNSLNPGAGDTLPASPALLCCGSPQGLSTLAGFPLTRSKILPFGSSTITPLPDCSFLAVRIPAPFGWLSLRYYKGIT